MFIRRIVTLYVVGFGEQKERPLALEAATRSVFRGLVPSSTGNKNKARNTVDGSLRSATSERPKG